MICKKFFDKYKKSSKKGFTLVEIIVTVAIVAIASGATLTVFLMVHDVTDNAKDITVQQYYTGQTERMIRNELQVASAVDIRVAELLKNGNPLADEAKLSDGYIDYDQDTERLSFYRCEANGSYTEKFTVDNVTEVQITIMPLNNAISDRSGQNYKLFYEITTSTYTYSGGFVLSNTEVQGRHDTCFRQIGAPADPHTIVWRSASNGGNTNTGSPDYGNTYALVYHRDKAVSTGS